MTPVAARRRQDVGRMDSRGCWASRRGRVGSACGFALPGDGRHKWRPYVWRGGDGVVGRRWWMLGGPSRACGHPLVVSPCRVILAFACRRGAIYDARCRPWAARCRPHGPPRGVRRVVAGVLGPPVVSPCRATGVINGAPTFGVVAMRWLVAGGGCWVSRRGRVLLECLSFLPRRPLDRVLRRYGQVGCRRRGGWRGMDGAVRYTFYYI